MKKRVVLAPAAESDIEALADYTRVKWGEKQRRAYLADLKACVMALGLMPGLGRARDELKPGWSSIRAGSHVVLYIEHPDRIEIIRVVHGAQDIAVLAED
jgi:toxin ParE1/3/4